MVRRVFEKFKTGRNVNKGEKEMSAKKTVAKKTVAKKTVRTKRTSKKVSFKDLSSDELNSLIARKAYEIFENRGFNHGNDMADWFEAEKIVRKSIKR